MNVLDQTYKAFDIPKKCIYDAPTELYDIKVGAIVEQKEVNVIGESDLFYVTGFYKTESVFTKEKGLGLHGFHKSRLVYWLPTQLSLF